jgi:hypothetical protein
MPLTPPSQAIYPKKYIKKVNVLYDGTKPPYNEFSIAELELHDGKKAIGIRHDRNTWNEKNQNKGYPTVRGGRPSWLIVPDIDRLLPILNDIHSKLKVS